MGKIIDIRKVRPNWPHRTQPSVSGGKGATERRNKFQPLLPFCKQINLADSFEFIFGFCDPKSTVKAGDFIVSIHRVRKAETGFRPPAVDADNPPKSESEAEHSSARDTERLAEGSSGDREVWYLSPVRIVGDSDEARPMEVNEIALRPRGRVSSRELWNFFTLGHEHGYVSPFLTRWFERNTESKSPETVFERLASVQIPILPDALVKAFANTFATGEWLSGFMADESEFEGPLSAQAPDDLYLEIGRIQGENYAIGQAISESRELKYLISNFFPFPLACPYRGLTAHLHQLELFREQLRMGENIVAFVGSVVFSLLGTAPAAVRSIFSEHRSFSMGVWVSLIREAGKGLPSDRVDDLAGMLSVILRNSALPDHAARLTEIRNRYHGHGTADSSQLPPLIEESQSLIDRSMERLSFLVQYPIFRVLPEATKRRGDKAISHVIQEYSGDNPAHRVREMQLDDVLPEGVYIQTDSGPRDLYPFITVHTCPVCHRLETFFLDRRKGKKGDWILKSFEQGHEIETRQIAMHLSAWLGKSET